jgi:hypothetical protein
MAEIGNAIIKVRARKKYNSQVKEAPSLSPYFLNKA